MKYVILYTTTKQPSTTQVLMVSYGIPKTYESMQDTAFDISKLSKRLKPRVASLTVGMKFIKALVERNSGYRRRCKIAGSITNKIDESKKTYEELLPLLIENYKRTLIEQKRVNVKRQKVRRRLKKGC